MKNHILSTAFVSALLAILPAAADTITLKDGTVYEGKILRKEGDVYVIEYNVTKTGSIKDIKRVPLLQMGKVIEVRQDEIEFAKLEKLVPTPDLLTAEDYTDSIQLVKAFLTKYPTGTKLRAAKALLKTLTDEASIVEAGGRKINGMMISAADYRANAYDMDAQVLEVQIRKHAKAGHSIQALRTFVNLDETFQASKSYREVLPMVIKMLQKLRGQVASSISSYETRMEKQTREIESMSGNEQATVKRAINHHRSQLEARYQKEKSASQLWVTPSSKHLASLEDCASQIDTELSRLTSDEVAGQPGMDPGKSFREALKLIQSKADYEEIEKAITDAQAAGLPEAYVDIINEAVKAEGIKPGEDSNE